MKTVTSLPGLFADGTQCRQFLTVFVIRSPADALGVPGVSFVALTFVIHINEYKPNLNEYENDKSKRENRRI